MIVVEILGGLGNQMFQYAAARALAERLGESLFLDVSEFDGYQLHNGFELTQIFNGHKELASKTDVRKTFGLGAIATLRRLMLKLGGSFCRRGRFILEPHVHYWSGFECIQNNAYLSGYWQSEKYFKMIEPIILNDFSFKLPMSRKNQLLFGRVKQSNAVSIHVRRGDYVSNTANLSIYGACDLSYYQRAILFIAERIKNPEFFVFSDDIEWVKRNLNMGYPCEYIDHNHGNESYNDMRLMSLCKHNIIANSSFSWWGAWLNQNKNKTVIAPNNWFIDPKMNAKDLIPASWVRL